MYPMRIGRLLLITMMTTTIVVVSSCKSSMKKADENLNLHQYAVAADMYGKVYKDKKTEKIDQIKAAYNAAECYRLNHDSRNALKWYATAERKGMKDPVVVYKKAEMMMREGQYTEAIVEFQKYQKMAPGDPRSAQMIKGCEVALTCKDKKTRYIIENFKVANESKFDDYAPMWADKKHNTIMFTSDRPEGESKEQHKWTGRGYSDVWMVEKKGKRGRERWNAPALVEGLNSKFNDGVVTFDSKYSVMYFTQCNGEKGNERTCKIYEARRRGKAWDVTPTPLPFCSDSSANYGHPALSPDGKKLYFVSDMPGSMQSEGFDTLERTKDIYVVNYVSRGRTWSPPINLGPTINTTANEMFPFVHDDGTLYFASDGHPGLGGLDIYYSTGVAEEWSAPVNMGCPVNSKGDDFAIILDDTKEYGFFTSDRAKGDDDIYEFSMIPMVFILKGTITDCDKKSTLGGALVTISNNKDTSKIRITTDRTGFYETPLKLGYKYEINVSKREDYYYDAKPKFVSTEGLEQSSEFIKDFCLKNQCDDIFVLPIYYGLDSANLRQDSRRILEELVETLKKYPKMKVELGSHTDCRAPFDYNRALSQRRADSAVAYLMTRGINPFRLEARGYGESQLVNKCECEDNKIVPCTEAEHQENRRTTVKVVNCNYEFKTETIDKKNINEAALNPIGGPIYSPFLIEKRKEYLLSNKDSIDKIIKAIEAEDKKKQDELERARLAELYDIITLTKQRDKMLVDVMVDKKKIRFYYNPEALRTEIPQNTVEQLLKAKSISIDDFSEGKEKIRFTDGSKVTSKSFKIKEITIDGVTFKNVRCKMVEDDKKPTMGNSLFDDYDGVEVKDDKLLLKKRKE